MSRLPVALTGSVALDTGSPSAGDNFSGGFLTTAAGAIRATVGSPLYFTNGVGFNAVGQMCVYDATSGLPAGYSVSGGLVFAPTGALCVSSNSVAGVAGGIPYDANGAIAVTGLAALPALSAALTNWRFAGTERKTVLMWGDSTTQNGAAPLSSIPSRMGNYTANGLQLQDVTIIDGGESGRKLSDAVAGIGARTLAWVNSQSFDVAVLCWGINDLKDGSRTKAQLKADLTTAVNSIRTAKPTCEIILWTPNAFLTSDPTGSNYILPNISFAQGYSDNLRDAYLELVGTWPTYVTHVSKRTITGDTPGATNSNWQDTIHPSNTANDAYALQIANVLRPLGWPYNVAQPASDPFWANTVLLMNGVLTDATGRHTFSNASGTVTASGGWLNFDGSSGLNILGNLGDFAAGTDSPQGLTVELMINCPSGWGASNGTRMITNGQLEISTGSSPNYNLTSANPFSGGAGPNLCDGNDHNVTWCYSRQRITMSVDGVGVLDSFSSNAMTSAAAIFLGQATDAWSAVFFKGKMRVRVTRQNRYNHAHSFVPPTWPCPTS